MFSVKVLKAEFDLHIESIGVVTKIISISSRVVNGNVRDGKTLSRVDRETLDRSIDDVETRDLGRPLETVSVEELWLGLSSVGSLTIPPFGTIAVEFVTGSARDRNVGPRNGEKWTRPLLILPCRGSFEDDLAKISNELAFFSGSAY